MLKLLCVLLCTACPLTRFANQRRLRVYHLFIKSEIKNSTSCQSSLICKVIKSIGGGKRDRTDDPLLAKQVLYQLSYAPNISTTLLVTKFDGGSGRT